MKKIVEAYACDGWHTDESLIYAEKWLSGALSIEKRPELSRLCNDIKRWEIDIVLVWKIDRLFRSVRLLLEFTEFLQEHNVNFVSRSENIDLWAPTWTLILTVFWAIAEMERNTIKERTTAWKKSKAMEWYHVYGSQAPYWYKRVPEWRWYKLDIHEEESKVVKQIFDLYVNQNKTIWEISDYLTSIRAPIRENKIKKKIGQFNRNHISRILKNDVYLWFYTSNKSITKQIAWKVEKGIKDSKEWISTPCPILIDNDIWMKAQEKLAKVKIMTSWRWNEHFYTWLLKCDCWKAFNHYLSWKKTSHYRCGNKNRSKLGPNQESCNISDISELKLHEIVRPRIMEMLQQWERFIEKYKNDMLLGENSKRIKEIEDKISNSLDSIEKAQLLKSNAVRSMIISPDLVNEIKEEIRKIDKEIEIYKSDLDLYRSQKNELEDFKKGFTSVEALQELYKENLNNISENKWKELTHKFIDSIHIWNESIKIIMRVSKNIE